LKTSFYQTACHRIITKDSIPGELSRDGSRANLIDTIQGEHLISKIYPSDSIYHIFSNPLLVFIE